jgi:hypothetical protein
VIQAPGRSRLSPSPMRAQINPAIAAKLEELITGVLNLFSGIQALFVRNLTSCAQTFAQCRPGYREYSTRTLDRVPFGFFV